MAARSSEVRLPISAPQMLSSRLALVTRRCPHALNPAGNGEVPMGYTRNPALSKLDFALSEFSKARWATEPAVDAPLEPTDLDLVASTPSSLGKQASLSLACLLIAFCIGVA